jgi:hypothetical protein
MSGYVIATWVLSGVAMAAAAVAVWYAISAMRSVRHIRALNALASAARNPGAAIAEMERKAKQYRGEN